ncbi:MAG: hypothetical protein GY742_22295 [Hyphomicrobiales bacterium]|nr:hypothetical protein [Hyphomicrobiales bacterium]
MLLNTQKAIFRVKMMEHSKLFALFALGVALSGSPITAQDALKPKEHFKIERPAQLKSSDANI